MMGFIMLRWMGRIWLSLMLITGSWFGLVRLAQSPLPLLLYTNSHSLSLYAHPVNCSLFSFCPDEYRIFDGLNLSSVAIPSPDGAYIAIYETEIWAIYPLNCLLNLETCSSFKLDEAIDNRIAWGPDGTTLAYMADPARSLMHVLTRGCWDGSPSHTCLVTHVDVMPGGVMRQPDWRSDGRQMIFVGLQPAGLFVLDTACLAIPETCPVLLAKLQVEGWPLFWPGFSPDGTNLLYGQTTAANVDQLFMLDITTGVSHQFTFRSGGAYVPDWSADGRYITFAGFANPSNGDSQIYLLDGAHNLTVRAAHRRGDDLTFPVWMSAP